MIVKVQTPLFSNTGVADQVLIYDKKRKFVYEGPSSEVTALMRELGEHKAYFNARVVNREFEIISQAEEQDW